MKKQSLSKRLISCILAAILVFGLTIPSQVVSANESSCSTCDISSEPKVISSHYDDDGNLIKMYDNGVEVVHYTDGDVVVNDYTHVFSDSVPEGQTRSISGTLIAIVKVVVTSCSIVQLIDSKHRNPCYILVNLIYDGLSSIPSGNYKIYANYVPGYIPGCEPRHSAPCNAGYWQYSATRS